MENDSCRIFVRLSLEQRESARQLAASLGMTLSELVRVLLDIAELDKGDTADARRAIVVDTISAAQLAREMRRWGYQYNQVVHALNRLAYFMERGKADRLDAAEELEAVSEKLGALDAGIQELTAQVSALVGHDVVYR